MNATEMELCEHPFVKGLRPEHRELLLESATPTTVRAGEVIFRPGNPANRFFLIETGRVVLETCTPKHDVVVIQSLGPGEVLGWSWLFEPFVWQFQARATEPVTMLVLDAAHLLRLTNENHEFGYELMKRVTRVVICCLQSTRQRLLDLTDRLGPARSAA